MTLGNFILADQGLSLWSRPLHTILSTKCVHKDAVTSESALRQARESAIQVLNGCIRPWNSLFWRRCMFWKQQAPFYLKSMA
ncbi:hypothetical protein MASSI9I_20222 [Massilia sp. 9I]|nr:hypothetical protein MASSI9I_20222 [Massilia sp. 9I]